MLTCPGCDEQSPLDARFCAFCGSALSGAGSSDTTSGNKPAIADAIWALSRFINEPGDPRLHEGLRAYDELRFEESIPLLEPFALEGNLTAIFKLGNAYDRLGNERAALALWRVAAREGEPLAQNNLGLRLQESGQLVEAEEMFSRAAAQGNPEAAYNLSWILRERGDLDGYERILNDLGRSGYTMAFARLGIQGLQPVPSASDTEVLRSLNYLSLGARQGSSACCGGMVVAALRFGEWYLMEPWSDEALAMKKHDGSEEWISESLKSLRFGQLVGERRWDDVIAWINDPANETGEVSLHDRRSVAEAILASDPALRRPDVFRHDFLREACTGLGHYGVHRLAGHEPIALPILINYPPPRPNRVDRAWRPSSEHQDVISNVDVASMASLAREAMRRGRVDEADFWYLEWITADCSAQNQVEGLTEYCREMLIPQQRFEEAALYLSVLGEGEVEGVTVPQGLIAAWLTVETARHFSALGRITYSPEWESVDRSGPLTDRAGLDIQYHRIVSSLMSGGGDAGSANFRVMDVELAQHYLSAVAGFLLGMEHSLGATGVSTEVLARAINDWLAFRAP